jgi:hypothetical protein
MKSKLLKNLVLGVVCLVAWNCSENSTSLTQTENSTLLGVAQTSGQLASGTSFSINGVADSTSTSNPDNHHGGHREPGHHGHPGFPLDGTNLLAPTNELLAIIDAESAGDFRGMHMHNKGGATLTNYDASGNAITLPTPEAKGPEGCSFSGGQFPKSDSLLSKIAKTIIDFGSGVTEKHDTVSITRSGKIIITRSGDKSNHTETITFENYTVNDNRIEGIKTRVSTFVKADLTTTGSSVTSVTGGKITFSDGTVATWTSDKQRNSNLTLDSSSNKPISGEITTEGGTVVTSSDNSILYSHLITKAIIENVACGRNHHGPVRGTIETHYKTDAISIDFGDGSCDNKTITININGVTTSKTIGE